MKYFVNEDVRKASGSSCYFEFQKGRHPNECWLPDSISIDMDIFDELKLYELIKAVVPAFDYYGITEIGHNDWNNIVKQGCVMSGKAEEAIREADEWATKAFSEVSVITIWGI